MATDRPHRLRLALDVLGATVALAILAFAAAARIAPEVRRGPLLEQFADYDVAEVDLLGVHVLADLSGGAADAVTAGAFALAGVLAAAVAFVLRRQGTPAARAFGLAAAGALFLAADDVLAAHETVGHNLPWLASLPAIDHPDDAIIGLYAVLAAAFAWRHRALAAGTSRRLVATCLLSGGLAAGHDVLPLHLGAAEEALEVVAAGALLAVAIKVAVRELRAAHAAVPAPG